MSMFEIGTSAFEKGVGSKLCEALQPTLIRFVDESYMHARGAQTHFKLTLVSDHFEGQSLVRRHQVIYRLLAQELAAGLHALSLHLYTPAEWLSASQVHDSPQCRGGESSGA